MTRPLYHERARTMYATGQWTQTQLAAFFGVSQVRVSQVLNPERTAHVENLRRPKCRVCGGPTGRYRRAEQPAGPRCRACANAARRPNRPIVVPRGQPKDPIQAIAWKHGLHRFHDEHGVTGEDWLRTAEAGLSREDRRMLGSLCFDDLEAAA